MPRKTTETIMSYTFKYFENKILVKMDSSTDAQNSFSAHFFNDNKPISLKMKSVSTETLKMA